MTARLPAHRRKALARAVLALALVAGLSSAAPVAATAATPGAAAPARSGAMHTVTLINGDRVTVTDLPGGHTTTVVHGPAGQAVGAHVVTFGARTFVYPDAVAPYVAAGLLDERLFDVTGLIAAGYDDAHIGRLPLIVEYGATAARRTPLPGTTQVRTLDSVHGAAVEQDRAGAARFWQALTAPAAAGKLTAAKPVLSGGITKVWLDGKVRAALADTTTQIGAPTVWATGNTGAGVDVAVLDTGVDQTHPDLAGQIAEAQSFVPGQEVTDRHGHGTHVASTIAGTGAASQGLERGVAPGVRLHVGKVLNDQGEGQDSWIIAGMEWAARQQHAKVVSMSLGGAPTDGTDPLSRAVDELSAQTGALFTIAAGNSGPDMQTVGAPGAADAALTVGAVDGQDRWAFFSSSGPRRGDNALKPDLSGPGVDVLAARSQQSGEGEGMYTTMSGTSMATPHVAGAAALLAAKHPGWTGRQLKDALMSTSRAAQRLEPYRDGSGRVDAAGSVAATVFATGSDFTALTWPYQPGQRIDRTVSYTNTGDAAVTLDLSMRAPTAPEGLFTLTADRVTVPAHGTAQATVRLDLDRAADDTYANASVDAAGPDGVRLTHTLVGMNKEGQRARLTFQARDRDGSGLSGLLLINDITRNTTPRLVAVDATGHVDLRLPTGTYSAVMHADMPGLDGPDSLGLGMLFAPETVLTGDRTVVLDARRLRRVSAEVKADTASAGIRVDYGRTYADRFPMFDNYTVDKRYHSVWATPTGKDVTQGTFSLGFRWSLVQPPLTIGGYGQRFDDLLMQTASRSLPEGSEQLDLVYAGNGSPAELAGARVRGKVAVVRRDPAVDVVASTDAAAAAGAKLLVVVNDGPGRLDAWTDVPDPNPALPVASIGRSQGELLIAQLRRGRARHTVTAHPVSDYVYDLVRRHRGAVPADLSYRPGPRDLARIDVSFERPTPGTVNFLRYDVSPEQSHAGLGGPVLLAPAQGRRTDWVSAEHDNQWFEQAMETRIMLSSDLLGYRPGARHEVSWFAPVGRPSLLRDSLISGVPTQLGNEVMIWNLPSWGDADPHHQGQVWEGEIAQTTSLYQGGDLITEGPGSSLYGQLTPGAGRVRIVNRGTQQVVSPYSTSTQTAWTFPFTPAASDESWRLPLIGVHYAVDTDVLGRADRRAGLTVSAAHHPDAHRAGKIRAVTVELSYDDGRTWRRATLTQRDGGWRTTLDAPRAARFVAVRVTAVDTAGNTVTQTVERAFGLR
ncbi:S8 family serine peptidase [Catellatospora vulcania]|uniref:S8 family serine peptidase n=1 Tax=Catellatospora vulcania TaxID=1460450 RepID=UPI0012D3AECB|nr:S8 family serine peptidase [Catellatospora vulcania]